MTSLEIFLWCAFAIPMLILIAIVLKLLGYFDKPKNQVKEMFRDMHERMKATGKPVNYIVSREPSDRNAVIRGKAVYAEGKIAIYWSDGNTDVLLKRGRLTERGRSMLKEHRSFECLPNLA